MVKAFPAFPFHKERMAQAFVNLGVTQAMSPNVGNFVHDLVEMAKAMETLPQVQAEKDQLQVALDRALDAVQVRETNILSYKQQIEDLQSKVRSLEVERDDASFRVLEAEDKAHNVLAMARSVAAAVGNMIFELDPPKPEPELTQATPLPEPDASGWNHGVEPAPQPQDQSVSNPTGTQQAGTQEVPIADAPDINTSLSENASANVQSGDTASTNPEPSKPDAEGAKPLGPYFNKRYYDQPDYMPLYEWLAGDGTETDYHWRPDVSYRSSY